MADTNQIKIGQTITVIFPWREDEHPTANNFFAGQVLEKIERANNCFYVRVSGLENIQPIDRVSIA